MLELRTTVARGVERSRLAAQLRQRVGDLEQANETIRALNLELGGRVEQATAELREQITARDEFMSTVSHDLKSPLTFIKGMANLRRRRARETPETQPLIDALDQIEASAGRMAQQLDELVDASRLEAGRTLELRRERDGPGRRWRAQAVAEHQQTTDRHVLHVSSDAAGAGRHVGRACVSARVLDNLLDNAVKYSPRGGTIEVAVGSRGARSLAVLGVSDRGEGIPAA